MGIGDAWIENATSAQVKSLPSCHVTPSRRSKVLQAILALRACGGEQRLGLEVIVVGAQPFDGLGADLGIAARGDQRND